jgi:cytochrome P450
MAFSDLPLVVKLVVGLTALYTLYQIVTQLALFQRRQGIRRQKGALDAPYFPGFRDHILGFDLFRQNLAAIKEHTALSTAQGRFAQAGSNTMKVILVGRVVYFTQEPEILKHIQAIDFKKWSLGYRRKTSFTPLLGVGIFTSDGAEWHHSREMLRPNFVRSQVGDLATFDIHVSHLINGLPKDGTTVDLSERFFRLTMDSATEFLFGDSTNSLINNNDDGFATAFTRGQDHIGNMARFAWLSWLLPSKHWKQDQKFVHDFVDTYVQKGLAKRSQLLAEKSNADKTGRYVFIDELVRQTTDPIRIRSELLNILLAGRDTTASLLTNAWFILSKRPDIWAKLQAEVAQLKGAQPTFEQLKDMKYLKAVLNESLRLHPVVPANSREATEDTVLPVGGGPDGNAPLFIKKGQLVGWSVWAMHRRKDLYGEDAEEFRPERWLDDPVTGKKGLRPGWEYLPFNGGPRICLVGVLPLKPPSSLPVADRYHPGPTILPHRSELHHCAPLPSIQQDREPRSQSMDRELDSHRSEFGRRQGRSLGARLVMIRRLSSPGNVIAAAPSLTRSALLSTLVPTG